MLGLKLNHVNKRGSWNPDDNFIMTHVDVTSDDKIGTKTTVGFQCSSEKYIINAFCEMPPPID